MLLDDLLDHYVDWRESARAVADAYARSSFASAAERAMRFAAHTAALDREQKTAAAYADAVTRVERWLQRSHSAEGCERVGFRHYHAPRRAARVVRAMRCGFPVLLRAMERADTCDRAG
jgi:hypothetical protein